MPRPGKRSRVRLIVIALILAPILWGLWEGVFSHDYNLWRISCSYATLQHPHGTKLVAYRKEVGLLIGQSKHTDYFVGELRSYSCSEEKINSYYANKRLRNPVTGKLQGVGVLFSNFRVCGRDFPSALWDLWGPQGEENNHWSGKFYAVFFFDAGYPPGLDFRSIQGKR